MPKGGARAGAGRKPGSVLVTKTRAVAEAAIESGEITPLEVMLHNMRNFHEKGVAVVEQMFELLPKLQASGDVDLVREFMKMLNLASNFQMNAEECARDAAPYIHPRLASVEFKPKHDTPVETIRKLMTPKDAARAYLTVMDNLPANS